MLIYSDATCIHAWEMGAPWTAILEGTVRLFYFLSSEQSNSGRTAVTQTQSLDRHKFTLQLPDLCVHHVDQFLTFFKLNLTYIECVNKNKSILPWMSIPFPISVLFMSFL